VTAVITQLERGGAQTLAGPCQQVLVHGTKLPLELLFSQWSCLLILNFFFDGLLTLKTTQTWLNEESVSNCLTAAGREDAIIVVVVTW
jgi:hypothetical protein